MRTIHIDARNDVSKIKHYDIPVSIAVEPHSSAGSKKASELGMRYHTDITYGASGALASIFINEKYYDWLSCS